MEQLEQVEPKATETEKEEKDVLFEDWPMMQERLKYMPKERGLLYKLFQIAVFCLLTYIAYRLHIYFAFVCVAAIGISVIIMIYTLFKTRLIKATIWPFILSLYLLGVSLASIPVIEIPQADGTIMYQFDIDEKVLNFFLKEDK